MPGRGAIVHPPGCPNCDAPELQPHRAEYEHHKDRIDLTCRRCGHTVGWRPEEKYIIRCQACHKIFVNRYIAPAYKEYVTHENRRTEIRYTCDACSGDDGDVTDEEEGDGDADVVDNPDPEADDEPDEQQRPRQSIEDVLTRRARAPIRDDLPVGRRR